MKKISIILVLLLILPSILALDLQIEKLSSNEIMVAGLKEPTVFNLKITNNGSSDNFEFYNLAGFNMLPVGTTQINSGQTKEVELKISPIGEITQRGFYTFKYFIRSKDGSDLQKELTFKIINLKDAFEIGTNEINSESSTVKVYFENKANFNFENINAKFTSAFFNFEETFKLEPYGTKEFSIELDKEDFKSLTAGFYTLSADIAVENQKAKVEGTIRFLESGGLKTTEENYGLIINTQIIKKSNEGNVASKSETIIEKNILSRLFTTFSPEPDLVERQGATVTYTWATEIKPGDDLEIKIKTNWLAPVLAIFFIIAIIIFTKQYSKTDLSLRKKVSFIPTKGGEFALKVTLFIKAKKYLERVNIIDRLPQLVKVHEKFGSEVPSRVNEKTRRIEWNFEKLEAGEIRLMNYIIYSKMGIVGKFALPSAIAIYEREGKITETESNRAFFLTEPKNKKEFDE